MTVPPCIVVGIDFSKHSERAFDAAIGLAEDMNASIVLVHAIRPAGALAGMASMVDFTGSAALQVQDVTEDDAVTLSTEWASRARARGIETQTVIRVEAPHRLITDTADNEKAALIVVGTHGRTGAMRMVLGSIAEKVVRHSHRPVLVVPATIKPAGQSPDPGDSGATTTGLGSRRPPPTSIR